MALPACRTISSLRKRGRTPGPFAWRMVPTRFIAKPSPNSSWQKSPGPAEIARRGRNDAPRLHGRAHGTQRYSIACGDGGRAGFVGVRADGGDYDHAVGSG